MGQQYFQGGTFLFNDPSDHLRTKRSSGSAATLARVKALRRGFLLAGYVYYPPEETGFDIAADYPAIDTWRNRRAAMKGWKPPYEMMPVGSSLPVRTG